MAIEVTALGSLASTSNVGTYTTSGASTAAAGSLVLAFVTGAPTTGSLASPRSFSGQNVSFTEIGYVRVVGGNPHLILFAGTATNPVAGEFSYDCEPSDATGACLSIMQVTGHHGQAPVVQVVTGTGTAVNTLELTLATLKTDSVTVSAFSTALAEAITPRAGWTEVHDINFATPNRTLETQYIIAGETTASASWTSNATVMGLAAEIMIAQTVPAEADDDMRVIMQNRRRRG